MKHIPLTQGKFAIVDDSDYALLSQFKWFCRKDSRNHYAARKVDAYCNQSMHQLLMPAPEGFEVDHKDGNGLNNQRSNLRLCTHAENSRNHKKHKNNRSGFKGVSWKQKNRRWCAQVTLNRKVMHLGLFKDPKDAAIAYDSAAERLYGEFAMTNKRLGYFDPVL